MNRLFRHQRPTSQRSGADVGIRGRAKFRGHLEPLETRQLLTASPLINEIYFDPPGGGDAISEYVELRGTPSQSLNNTYLIFLENENDVLNLGNPGMVERFFDLGGKSIGSNGFLTLRQNGNPYTVAPGTSDYVNTVGLGWGEGASTIGYQSDLNDYRLENSGFTAMLIVNNGSPSSAPFIGQDLDIGNDGLDVPTGHADWTILDFIGIHGEVGESEFGRLYAPINFGPDGPALVEPGATYIALGYEVEYIGRYGNSTGQTAADWHISNLTDNLLSGYTGTGDFRQSGTPHGIGAPGQIVDTNQNVPYGTNLTNTLGAVNFPGVINSSVVGRRLFYNQSGTAGPLRYDGNNAQINANDDLAIATDKTALLPGAGAATFANVSSYTKGINGIMVDIGGSHGTITAADFIFRVGNNNTPNSWVAAPAPSSISVRAGAGTGGSDRVVLTWANGAITKKWLEVIVLANANTNLAQKAGYPVGQGDVFFFGNALADSGAGDNATQAIVNVTDELGARNNPATLASNIPITNLYDYNRDGQVNTTDALAARNNPTSTGNVTKFLSIANPPTAPEASPASDGGVASALSVPSAGGALASAGVPRWLVNRLQNVDLNSGPIARYFEHLAEQNTPGTRKILVAADKVADNLGLDHELLDSLLADLGLE